MVDSADAVVLRDVSKVYEVESQRVQALRGLNLKVARGKLVSVTGKSGAGKSTLLHLIGVLDRPSSGNVFINGVDVSKLGDVEASQLRNRTVGFVFQMNNLLPEFSAIENVMMPGLIAGIAAAPLKDRASALLNAVGLSAREKHRPGELSGGEQQRVAIARSLLLSPAVVLADEPTGNLDIKTSHAVQDLLLELCVAAKSTMFLVTHDEKLASRLPHRVIMEDGQIVDHGDLSQ